MSVTENHFHSQRSYSVDFFFFKGEHTLIFGGPAGVELLVIIPDEAEFEAAPGSPL